MATPPTVRATAILVAALWSASPAAALVICKGPKGTLVARASCKKKELHLDATIIGAPGDRGVPGRGFVVLDKNGKEVGPVVTTFGDIASVLREIDGLPITFTVSSSGFLLPNEVDLLRYADADCAGPKLVSTPPGALGVFAHDLLFSVDGRTGFYGLPSEQEFLDKQYSITVISGSDDTKATENCTVSRVGKIVKSAHDCVDATEPGLKCVFCCAQTNTGALSPAHTVDVTALGLTPPFRLEPR
jgi:hypothetical protein